MKSEKLLFVGAFGFMPFAPIIGLGVIAVSLVEASKSGDQSAVAQNTLLGLCLICGLGPWVAGVGAVALVGAQMLQAQREGVEFWTGGCE